MALPVKPASGQDWNTWGTAIDAAVRSGTDLYFDTEKAQDTIGAMVAAAGGSYNDTAGTITLPTSSGSGSTNSGDNILFVSKAGNDANNGRSWGAAKLTIAGALSTLGSSSGKICVGAGTFDEAIPAFNNNKWIDGAGTYSTILRLTASGTLLDFASMNDIVMSNLCLSFASASVTGTLFKASNSFKHRFYNVRFLGQGAAGQVGRWELDNTGDCHFIGCKWENLGVGFKTVTSISYISHSQFSSNLTAFYGGDPTGVDGRGGIVCVSTGFIGAGDYYIDIDGSGLNFFFDGCWFDGTATTAVKVGKSDLSLGPRMFSMSHIPSLFGATNSLVLNKATRVNLDAIQFHHGGGTPPTELSIPSPTNVNKGSIRNVRSNQSLKPHALVPASWDGYNAPFAQDSNKIRGVQTSVLSDIAQEDVHKTVRIRVSGRIASDAQAVITFPTAFVSSSALSKTVDTTGFAGMTLSTTSLTIPTGTAGSGLIVIEGV